MDRVRSFLNLERGEELPAALLFLYLTLALASVVIAKTASRALFLAQFGALALPYAYIGVAILIGILACLYVSLSPRIDQCALICGTLLFFVFSVVLIWWGVRVRWTPAVAAFYVWTSIFAVVLTTQIWTAANSVLDLRQAKRLFPLVSSGGVLGGAAGGLIAAKLVKRLGTDNLALLLVPFICVCVVLVQILMRRHAQFGRKGQPADFEGSIKNVKSVLGEIGKSPYLQLIVALVAGSAIATLVIDFQFNFVAQRSFGMKDQLTAFFGTFYACLGLFSFLLVFVAGSRIIERFGVRVTLLILPVVLLVGTAALLVFPMKLLASSLLKGSDTALRHSIDKSAVELLYLPVEPAVKVEAKAVIDMVLQRIADAVGGVLLLAMTSLPGFGLTGVGVSNLVLISIWLWIALQMRREYVAAIRDEISKPKPRATVRVIFPDDNRSILTARSMLYSKDDEIVLDGIEDFARRNQVEALPAWLLTHPSPQVRHRATEVMRTTEAQLLERARVDNSSAVRVQAITRVVEMDRSGSPASAIGRLLQNPELKVQLAAVTYLARNPGKEKPPTIRQCLASIVERLDDTSEKWKEVAEALGDIQHPAAVELHLRLLEHPDRAVKKLAVLSAGRAGHRELVPHLIPLLADRRFAREARQALQGYGPRILGILADTLRDPMEGIDIRRSIPLVLAYMPIQGAVDLLLEGLFDYDGLLRYRAIRALGKLRVIDPGLRFDEAKVALRVREECEGTLWHQQALACLYPAGDSPDLLAQLLKDKINRGRERVFRLLVLLLPPSVACASFMAIVEEDRLAKAAVAEYLDNVLPGKLKRAVLPLIETRESFFRRRREVRTILHACLRSPDPILRDCAAEAIAKDRWPEFSRLVSAAPPSLEGVHDG